MQEIKRIDYIVHPFYHLVQPSERKIAKSEGKEIEAEWHKAIDRAAKEPQTALVIVFPNFLSYGAKGIKTEKAPLKQWQKGITKMKELAQHAKETLGNRFFAHNFFEPAFVDSKNREFGGFKTAFSQNGLSYSPKEIRTRGMGEYTLRCVFDETTRLNAMLGLKKPEPYKNPQSTILPKKSICSGGLSSLEKGIHYPSPAERRQFIKQIRQKKAKAKTKLHFIMQKYKNEKFAAMGFAKGKMIPELRRNRRI